MKRPGNKKRSTRIFNLTAFNDRVAAWISGLVGNISFFWTAFIVIAAMRVFHPPALSDLVLDLESDLSLLLLAIQAFVSKKQEGFIKDILKEIREGEKEIKAEAEEIKGKLCG